MKLVIKILFILGILLSFFLRFWNLTGHPPSLFSDEVDAGYQAFVFNHCHSDYYGHSYPTHFQSFADWRTPLYPYSIALSQKIFGATDFSIRFPAALFGSLIPLAFFGLIYYLTRQLFLALATLFLSAVNPWLLHYSRAGWEVTGMLLAMILGLLFWLKYFSSKKIFWLILSIIFFASTFYFYATAKLFIILLAPCLLIIWKKEIATLSRHHLIIAALTVLVVTSPLIIDTVRGRAGFRFSYINIFQLNLYQPLVDSLRYQDSLISDANQIGVKPSITSVIFHNKYTLLLSKFTRNYFSSFSTDYLFLQGDGHLRQGFGQKGNLLYPDIFLIILGFAGIVVDFVTRKSLVLIRFHWLMLFFLLLSPIPFSLTGDSPYPQSTRLIIMTLPLIYLVILGLRFLFSLVTRTFPRYFIIILLLIVFLLSFADFFYYYLHQYPLISAKNWHYGLKETVAESWLHRDQYQRLYYSSSYESFLPFFYWYTRYLPPPAPDGTCSPAGNTVWDNTDYFTGMQISSHYYFGHLDWSQLVSQPKLLKNSLFAVSQADFENLNQLITNQSPPLKMNIIWQIPVKFTEQEKLYLIELTAKL